MSPRRVLVLPDLHGRLDALEALLKAGAFVGAQGRPRRSQDWLVQLGDFLDRGPYRAVVCGHTPTASGRVEIHDGIFCCDIGLGHGSERGLECLELLLDEEHLSYKIVSA